MLDRDELPGSAEIVIIGAGVVGLSIAFHLAERGATGVVVLDRDAIASGETAKATGGIRQQFATAFDIRLSIESVHFYEDFEARVGRPFLFLQHGYLFLCSDQLRFARLCRAAELQVSLGVKTEILRPHEIKARYPMIDVSDLVGASFCASDGSGSPTDAAYAFAQSARDRGVKIVENAEIVGIDTDHSRVVAVRTAQSRIATNLVVNAAGPWAPRIGSFVGIDLPITVRPRQVFTVTAVDDLGQHFPFTVDLGSGVYIHQETGSLVLGGGDRNRAAGYEETVDWSRFEQLSDAVTHRVPSLAESRSIAAWCGLRDMTADEHPILGPVADVSGFWCAAGSSGHGFMHAPAIGRIMADWLLGGAPPEIDVAAISLERFASSKDLNGALAF